MRHTTLSGRIGLEKRQASADQADPAVVGWWISDAFRRACFRM